MAENNIEDFEISETEYSSFLFAETTQDYIEKQSTDYIEPQQQKREAKKRPAKKVEFTSSEKEKLAAMVKENEAIWNLNNKLHRNNHAVAAQWNAVAASMEKPVEDCKIAWRSLRDSKRYRVQAKQKRKSGSAAFDGSDFLVEEENIDSENIDWEFSNCMSFMDTLSSETKRRTISSSTSVTDGPNDSRNEFLIDSNSNYSYMNEKKQKDPIIDSVNTMVENVDTIINKEKAKKPKLKHGVMLQNLDRMLSQLTNDIVEDLNMKFINQTYDQIKKQQNISYENT